MFDGTRPIDWVMLVVELLVLLLIAYEVGSSIWFKWKTQGRLAATFEWMSKGQMLQQNAPPAGSSDEADSTAWVAAVQQWMEQTHHFLAKYSPQAAASFIHHKGGPSLSYSGVSGARRCPWLVRDSSFTIKQFAGNNGEARHISLSSHVRFILRSVSSSRAIEWSLVRQIIDGADQGIR